jgi:hypothetical protein
LPDDVQEDDLSYVHLEQERAAWMLRFFKVVQKDDYARDALAFLVTGGMDRERVASILFWYTDPRSAHLQSRVAALAKLHVKTLDAIQKALWDCQRELSESEIDRMTAPSSWPVDQIAQVAEVMLEASAYAGDLSYKLRPLTSAKGKLRNEEVLVSLCLEVLAVTSDPHWTDIAYLLDSAVATRGEDPSWDEDRLRKVFHRYQKTYPRQFAALKDRAGRMTDESRPEPGGKTSRSTRNNRIAQPKSAGVQVYRVTNPTSRTGSAWRPRS